MPRTREQITKKIEEICKDDHNFVSHWNFDNDLELNFQPDYAKKTMQKFAAWLLEEPDART